MLAFSLIVLAFILIKQAESYNLYRNLCIFVFQTVSLWKIIHDEIIHLSSTQLSTIETSNTQQLECHSSLISRHSEPDSSMNQTKFERG